ncbi:nitroreductase family protein [Brevibacillus sp. H7]|uniref:nitroreductase family protein n=1 Tax=Brevibacillus sp. H7 TaxID=3349138 RepID=UPI0037FE443A
MDLWEALRGRRSIGVVKPEMPPREYIEKMLEAATWAPNHFLTEPWRFFVLTGDARIRLGEAMADAAAARMANPDDPESQSKLVKHRQNPLRAPVVIAVAASPSDQKRVVLLEEIEAVACAVQNMLLAAHGLGLGAIWRTGDITYEPVLKNFFNLGPNDQLLGFVYIGYPQGNKQPPRRTPFTEKTVWLDNQ